MTQTTTSLTKMEATRKDQGATDNKHMTQMG